MLRAACSSANIWSCILFSASRLSIPNSSTVSRSSLLSVRTWRTSCDACLPKAVCASSMMTAKCEPAASFNLGNAKLNFCSVEMMMRWPPSANAFARLREPLRMSFTVPATSSIPFISSAMFRSSTIRSVIMITESNTGVLSAFWRFASWKASHDMLFVLPEPAECCTR